MKKIFAVLIIWVLFQNKLLAQFEAVSYDFWGNAMALNTNPGASLEYKSVFAIPFFGNTQVFAGNSAFSPYDLLAENTSFQKNVPIILSGLKNTDNLLLYARYDLANVVWTAANNNVYNIGLYWELYNITYFPADLLRLGYDGNAMHLNDVFDAKYLASKTDLVQTLYFGIQKRFNNRFTLGYRFKLYNGLANAQTGGNSGKLYTTESNNNYYIHHLEDVDINVQTSGYSEHGDTQYYLSKLLLSGNMGLGTDLGFSFHPNQRTIITASILDLGFIYFSKDIKTYSYHGSFQYEGVALQFPETGAQDYWQTLKDDFNTHVVKTEGFDSYISWRPVRFYTSIKYGTDNLKKISCEDFVDPKTEYSSYIGLTGFAQVRPIKIYAGASVFYEKKWSKHFYTKLNLTADNYSFYALGGAVALNLGRLHFYVTGDNLLSLSDLAKSQKLGLQFGISWISFKP